MKIGCLFTLLFFLGIILVIRNSEVPKWSQIDSCLDRGHCWDYIRDRCEEIDQGYCAKDKNDCKDKNGIWDAEKQYCQFNFKNNL